MKTIGLIVIVLATPVLMGAAYYQHTQLTYNFRYRLTVEVETPQGLKSGSSVIEVKAGLRSALPNPGLKAWDKVAGDAVLIYLGDGRVIVAVHASGPTANEEGPGEVIPRAFGLPGGVDGWRQMEGKVTGSVVLQADNLPTFLIFEDIDDPEGARVLAPQDFPETLGTGFVFKQALVELTDEPLTRGIDKRISWLAAMRENERTHGAYGIAGQLNLYSWLFEGEIR
ncbi:MAG: hypothetical protein WAZ27_00380 [Minisyncoccia bacterium]